jgi:hypothetical protein
MAEVDRQKQLKAFVDRRHPVFEQMLPHWQFLEATYEGGREWFDDNIFQYVKEGDEEFTKRLERAYRFNHTREVVDLLDKYLFKMEIARSTEVPQSVKRFWKSATLDGGSIDEFMKRVSNRSSVYGRAWIIVDSTNKGGSRTVAEEQEKGAGAYAYIIPPQHMLDMSYDELGQLNWVVVYETKRDDQDPIESSGEIQVRFRLWTREFSQLFQVEGEGEKAKIIENEKIDHGLGIVPAIRADNVITDDLYTAPALIADVAYLDRAVANYLSNMDAIIQDQTFSQLVMPAQGIEPGTDGYTKLVEMGTKRIFTYNAEHGGKPEFISPDVMQAELILKVVNKIINEIYHSIGLAGERTKEDNALGIDNSSGVAKAYDFERVNSLLASKADSLQLIENRVAHIVAMWHGEEKKMDSVEKPVLYPRDFDVRGLYDEFEIATRLSLIQAPDEVRRTQMDALISKLFPQMVKALKTKIQKELKTWPPKLVVDEPGQIGPAAVKREGAKTVAKAVTKE